MIVSSSNEGFSGLKLVLNGSDSLEWNSLILCYEELRTFSHRLSLNAFCLPSGVIWCFRMCYEVQDFYTFYLCQILYLDVVASVEKVGDQYWPGMY